MRMFQLRLYENNQLTELGAGRGSIAIQYALPELSFQGGMQEVWQHPDACLRPAILHNIAAVTLAHREIKSREFKHDQQVFCVLTLSTSSFMVLPTPGIKMAERSFNRQRSSPHRVRLK